MAAHLEKRAEYQVVRGIEVVDLSGPSPIAGSICKIELGRHEFRLFLFRDLVNKSLHPDYGCFTQTSVNLGASVRDFILGNRYECEGLQSYPNWRPPYRDVHRRCLVASNTLQTNFIRSNGFVIENGRVVAKPRYAPGRDDPGYVELGVAGEYTCLLVSGLGANARAQVIHVSVRDVEGEVTDPPLPAGSCGIASPLLVREGRFAGLERHAAPFRDSSGRLRGDWVPWDPDEAATSFTADITAEQRTRLRELFPEAFTEGKVDSEKLRATLGDLVDDGAERYRFTWANKRDAICLFQPSHARHARLLPRGVGEL
jgi:hypothetical protein